AGPAAFPAYPVTAQGNSPADARARCDALAGHSNSGLVIGVAELVEAGPAATPGPARPDAASPSMLPQHCRVRGTIAPRIGYGGREFGIGFELRLPVDWNGRFLFQGGGGMDGVIAPA